VKLTTPITKRRIGQPALLDLDLGRRRAGFFLANTFAITSPARTRRIALGHDEAPGRELAVIGHARADGEDGLELGRRGTGPVISRASSSGGF